MTRRFGGLAFVACAAIGLGLALPASADPAMDTAVDNAWSIANSSLYRSIGYMEANFGSKYATLYPQTTVTTAGPRYGTWNVVDANGLTGWITGHWTGQLWQQWKKTGDANMLQYAKDWTAGIEIVKGNPLDHDLGFRFMNSFGLAYDMLDDASDPAGTYRAHAKQVLIEAASALNTRFNNDGINAGLIEAVRRNGWLAPYGVVVDSMMNISLLFEGWDLSGRPTSGPAKAWYDHAVTHANTILAQNVRSFGPTDPRAADDGSTYHGTTHYDGNSSTPLPYRNDPNVWGKLYYKMTAQGFGDETTWSRGQAWSLYGFAQTYAYTRDDPDANVPARFLDTACRNANYFISHLPNNYTADPYNHRVGDFVPPSDFDAALGEPNGPWNDLNGDHVYGDKRAATLAFVARDSSAASIAASGLLELSTLVTDANLRAYYFDSAEDILLCLMTYTGSDANLDYMASAYSGQLGILAGASGAYGSVQNGYVVADYYFLEALSRYAAIVPEPACLAILAAGLATCALRRRRRTRGLH